jgi:tetratricopeptide (TPR) repeat protein
VERLAPESADVYFLRGLLAKSASEAVELYTRALELNPAHTWALLRRGGRYLDLKNFDAAMVDAERMLASRPRSPRGRRMLGKYYEAQLDFDRALAEYAKAIELDLQDPINFLQRGWVYDAMRRYDDSVADFTRAIEIGPPHAAFYRNRATAYSRLGRDEAAIADARTALELNPEGDAARYRYRSGHRGAFNVLLNVYQKLDRMDEFERTADELRARAAGWFDPAARADAYRNLSEFYRRAGDHEQARVEADLAVEADPDHLWARIERINVLRALNDDAGFEAECDALAALELEDPEPLEDRADDGLGWACLRWEKDVELLDEVVEDYPDWHLLYFDRGTAYAFLSRYEEALADLTRAIELNPLHALAYGNRAAVYSRLHRYEEDLADLDKALELDPRNANLLNNRGAVAMLLGQTEEGLRFLDRAIEVDPLYVWSRTNRAWILALLGRCSEAMDELQAVEGLLERTNKYTIVLVHTSGLFWNCPDGYDPVKALAYARESAEALPGEQETVAALGAALYRNGHYREAREALLKAQAMSSSASFGELFYLAMSSWQLGEKQQARSYYDQGLDWMNKYSPKSPLLIPLREEASRLLGIEP